jgi:AAA+ ATPase superfamily predicted ATPase
LYFDPRPKTKKEDLFNREKELKQFKDVLTYASIIVVTGLRRTGKTSFVDVALSETNYPNVFLDMRDLPVVPSRVEVIRKIETAFNKLSRKWLSQLSDTLKHVKGVNLVGGSITFDWGEKGVDLATLFDKIDSWAKNNKQRFLIAFDEIQLIRGDKSIPRLFARIADVNQNIVIIMTGSEIGLLYDFLQFDNPESPLYGRHYVEIKMHNFNPEETKTFLKKGFKQINIACPSEVTEYAAEKLDGVVGWLTLFGAKCRDTRKCNKQTVNDVLDEGGKLARTEALKIVKFSPRYGIILNLLSTVKKASWTKIKTGIELHEKRSLQSSTFTDLLNKLVKTSLIEKENGEYRIADPLLSHGIAKEPFKE